MLMKTEYTAIFNLNTFRQPSFPISQLYIYIYVCIDIIHIYIYIYIYIFNIIHYTIHTVYIICMNI